MLVMAAGTGELALLSVSTPVRRVAAALGTLGLGIAIFSTPNSSAIMGSVDRSVPIVRDGDIDRRPWRRRGLKTGREGGRVILLGSRAAVDNAQAFAAGYREAMLVGTGFAVVEALVSLTCERPRATPGHS